MDLSRKGSFCPNCGAFALEGHDDDFQIFCAKCGTSFKAGKTESLSSYLEKTGQKYVKHVNGAWEAYCYPSKN